MASGAKARGSRTVCTGRLAARSRPTARRTKGALTVGGAAARSPLTSPRCKHSSLSGQSCSRRKPPPPASRKRFLWEASSRPSQRRSETLCRASYAKRPSRLCTAMLSSHLPRASCTRASSETACRRARGCGSHLAIVQASTRTGVSGRAACSAPSRQASSVALAWLSTATALCTRAASRRGNLPATACAGAPTAASTAGSGRRASTTATASCERRRWRRA